MNKRLQQGVIISLWSAMLLSSCVAVEAAAIPLAVKEGIRGGTHFKVGVGYTPDLSFLVHPHQENQKIKDSIVEGIKEEMNEYREGGILGSIKEKGEWGLLGTDGQELIPPMYKEMIPITAHHYQVKDDKAAYLVNEKNEKVEAPTMQKEAPITSFKEKGKYGFKQGDRIVLAPQFKAVITEFSDGIAYVKNSYGNKVAIDITGTELFPIVFDDVDPFVGEFAEYRRRVSGLNWGGLLGYALGAAIKGSYYGEISGFTKDSIKRGYINREGAIVVDSKMDYVYPRTDYGFFVEDNGKAGLIGLDGTYIIPLTAMVLKDISLSDGFLVAEDKKTHKQGVWDLKTGTQRIPFMYEGIEVLGQNRALVKQESMSYLVNLESGNKIAFFKNDVTVRHFDNRKYTWGKDKENNNFMIDVDGTISYADKEGLITEIGNIGVEYTALRVGKLWGVMNLQGQWLVTPKYQEIKLFY